MSRSESRICILLSTFDGAAFLPAQLASLFAQDDPDWQLLVRDDGSSDASLAILGDAAARDDRVLVLDAGPVRLGSSASYFRLMEHALARGARYFALCDQDDVWSAQKLSTMRQAMSALEQDHGADRALLCWSDLRWIDAGQRLLADSHFRRSGTRAALSAAGCWLLAMNAVPGCAMLGNRALLQRALPQPPGVDHHDWWLALVAAALGDVHVIDSPLADYRQHAANAIGADALNAKILRSLRSPAAAVAKARVTYWQAVSNARQLRQRAAGVRVSPEWERALVHTTDELGSASRWRRILAVLRGPVRRLGWWRNVLMMAAAADLQHHNKSQPERLDHDL